VSFQSDTVVRLDVQVTVFFILEQLLENLNDRKLFKANSICFLFLVCFVDGKLEFEIRLEDKLA
jgi:hypothetical protein